LTYDGPSVMGDRDTDDWGEMRRALARLAGLQDNAPIHSIAKKLGEMGENFRDMHARTKNRDGFKGAVLIGIVTNVATAAFTFIATTLSGHK
jgi:hypothetical protein